MVNISEDARHWIGLLQYNPSTVAVNGLPAVKAVVPGEAGLQGVLSHHATPRRGSHLWPTFET